MTSPELTIYSGRLPDGMSVQVRQAAADCQQVDGVPPLSDQALANLDERDTGSSPVGRHHVIATLGTDIAGYAGIVFDADDATSATAELFVRPTGRRRGIGQELLTTSLKLTRAAGRTLSLWSHGDLTAAREVSLVAGFTEVRQLWQMRRSLTDFDVPTPARDGFTVSTFQGVEDEAGLLEVNAAAFAHHPEQGQLTAADLHARMAEEWFDPAGLFILRADDAPATEPAGFVWTKVHPATATTEAIGEIYVIGVDPRRHGQGLGRYLTVLGLNYLKQRGLTTALLYVEADATVATTLYASLGFSRHTVDVLYTALN